MRWTQHVARVWRWESRTKFGRKSEEKMA